MSYSIGKMIYYNDSEVEPQIYLLLTDNKTERYLTIDEAVRKGFIKITKETPFGRGCNTEIKINSSKIKLFLKGVNNTNEI